MIVKIKCGKYSWSYFEGDNLEINELNLSNTEANSTNYTDTQFFLRPDTKINVKQDCICGKEHNNGLLLCVQKEGRVIARIITNRATYLMNDLGKTVDKLF